MRSFPGSGLWRVGCSCMDSPCIVRAAAGGGSHTRRTQQGTPALLSTGGSSQRSATNPEHARRYSVSQSITFEHCRSLLRALSGHFKFMVRRRQLDKSLFSFCSALSGRDAQTVYCPSGRRRWVRSTPDAARYASMAPGAHNPAKNGNRL